MKKHDNTIVLYDGTGNIKPFKKFIKDNHFCDKIFLIKEGKDINNRKFTYTNLDNMYSEIDKLIDDYNYKNKVRGDNKCRR